MNYNEYHRRKENGIRILFEKRFDAVIKQHDAEQWRRSGKYDKSDITPEARCTELARAAFIDIYVIILIRRKNPHFVIAVIEQYIKKQTDAKSCCDWQYMPVSFLEKKQPDTKSEQQRCDLKAEIKREAE